MCLESFVYIYGVYCKFICLCYGIGKNLIFWVLIYYVFKFFFMIFNDYVLFYGVFRCVIYLFKFYNFNIEIKIFNVIIFFLYFS